MKLAIQRLHLVVLSALGFAAAPAVYADGAYADAASTRSAVVSEDRARRDVVTVNDNIAAHQMPASRLLGTEITNAARESLGEITELMIDVHNRGRPYAIVSFGGFFGVGDKLFAFPLERFRRSTHALDRDKLMLSVDQSALEHAPGFDRSVRPDFDNRDFRTWIDRFYSIRETAEVARYVKASEVLDGAVKNAAQEDIGSIHDIVVNLDSGRLHYVVLEFDRAWTPDDRLVAMPIRAFDMENGNRMDLVYRASRAELAGAPSFDKNRWPRIGENVYFRADVERFRDTWSNNSKVSEAQR